MTQGPNHLSASSINAEPNDGYSSEEEKSNHSMSFEEEKEESDDEK